MVLHSFLQSVFDNYSSIKNPQLFGRYITAKDIIPELEKIPAEFDVDKIGETILNSPIHSVTFGKGDIRILGWSQMHGNESTTTKAVFDLFNLFNTKGRENPHDSIQEILQKCTIKIIPMLNPDGAVRYTRENVNGIDLNRDAFDLREKESQILRSIFEDFKPHFCLNLHDQRTIFSAGDSKKPATLSFLAPSMDENRSVTANRKEGMQLITAINNDMQPFLPQQIGRYDDAFNHNCTGDAFQTSGVPTVLFEAGHYKHDYMREKTREFMALAILSAIQHISSGDYAQYDFRDYFQIPENEKKFFDVILRNAVINGEIKDVALQFEEKIKAGKISFDPVVQKMSKKMPFWGHQEINCEGQRVTSSAGGEINENAVVNQIMLKNNKLSIKSA